MAQPAPVAEQIVHLKAEYGMDDGNNNGTVARALYKADDNLVDNFTIAAPDGTGPDPDVSNPWTGAGCAACAWRSSRAASPRTGRPATPRPPTAPTSTATPTRCAGRAARTRRSGRPIDVRTTADWQCYRYRVYETTVPLRNMLWRQE